MRILLALLTLSVVPGCFSPDEPLCAFSCGPGGKCPPNYFCASDGYCHKDGYTAACPGYSDASVPDLGPPDMSMDMSGDMSVVDMVPFDMVPSCTNVAKDPLETDVDCGGSCVAEGKTCADGKMCTMNSDCQNGFCSGNVCFPAHCNNGATDTVLDGGLMETDQDCGGPCPKCANTKVCGGNGDCVSGNCVAGVCRPFTALAPCGTPGAYTTTGNTITFPGASFQYTPRCLRISRGASNMVTWNADASENFGNHPLNPSTRGTAGTPITVTNGAATTTASFNFTADGFFPFFCGVHGADDGSGMSGVIQVVP
jgi:hypothetical protein